MLIVINGHPKRPATSPCFGKISRLLPSWCPPFPNSVSGEYLQLVPTLSYRNLHRRPQNGAPLSFPAQTLSRTFSWYTSFPSSGSFENLQLVYILSQLRLFREPSAGTHPFLAQALSRTFSWYTPFPSSGSFENLQLVYTLS